jgi:hypothetical protein
LAACAIARQDGRCDALAPHAETHEAGGQSAQDRKIDEEPQEPWRHGFAGAAEETGNQIFLHNCIITCWPFAPLLHLRQKLIAWLSLVEQRPAKPRLVPKRQPVDRDGQELDVIEAFESGDATGEGRSQCRDFSPQGSLCLAP